LKLAGRRGDHSIDQPRGRVNWRESARDRSLRVRARARRRIETATERDTGSTPACRGRCEPTENTTDARPKEGDMRKATTRRTRATARDSYPRDLVGFAARLPDPKWPGGARLAP